MWSSYINKIWYTRHPLRWCLLPLSLAYQLIVLIRRWYLLRFKQRKLSVPILVIGNLTVGGVGKTPLVIAIAQQLQARGMRIGIVSRGYKAHIQDYPHEVRCDDAAFMVGDEPLLLAKKTGCPIVIDPNRVHAIDYLSSKYKLDAIISDDGLQHYAMARTVNLIVVDGVRGFGNGMCLPAGPLREPVHRLQAADLIVVNGKSENAELDNSLKMYCQKSIIFHMYVLPKFLVSLIGLATIDVQQLNRPIAAVAAIGNPARFFTMLRQLGVTHKAYIFPDHHHFKPEDLCFKEPIIVMTEKDAVKCKNFANENMYFLSIEAILSDRLIDTIEDLLRRRH